MGWRFFDEAVEMVQRRHGWFPQRFIWRGRAYEVDGIDRCWEVGRRWGRPARRCFRLKAGGASFELYHDLELATWHLRRARWQPAAASSGRVVLPTRLAMVLPEPMRGGSGVSGP
jgi:hypothetical protein